MPLVQFSFFIIDISLDPPGGAGTNSGGDIWPQVSGPRWPQYMYTWVSKMQLTN